MGVLVWGVGGVGHVFILCPTDKRALDDLVSAEVTIVSFSLSSGYFVPSQVGI